MESGQRESPDPTFEPGEYERTSRAENAPGETGQMEQEPPQPGPSSQPKPSVPTPESHEAEHVSQDESALGKTRERE